MAVKVDIFNPQVSVIAHGLEGKVIMVYGGNNLGKAQPVDTMIPTPDGYKRLGDLKVGDHVFNRSGEPTKVLNIYEQGVLDNYEVTLSDGRVTYCNDEHLWTVWTSRGHFETKTLREMIDSGLKKSDNKAWRYQIPNNRAVEYAEKEFKIDPYVMGCFIGDGCTTCAALTFSTPEEAIVEDIAKRIGAGKAVKSSEHNYNWTFDLREEDKYKASNGGTVKKIQTKEFFRDYPEVMTTALYKKIPEEYLYGNVEQRWELVRGLMDTDGTIAAPTADHPRHFTTSYSTNSEVLSLQVLELFRSLGIKVSRSCYEREDKENTEYVITICLCNTEKHKLFKNSVKMERAIQAKEIKTDKDYDKISVVGVKRLDKPVEMRCIYVKNDEHLYLTNDYIVTHNTQQAARAEKPYFFACESGLNGISGVAYNKINNWYDFTTAVNQFTSKSTVDKAKELYSTIVIDEVYASAMFCQDYICQSYGNGAIDLGDDTGNTRLNLYRLYEKEYWRQITKLVGAGYTVIFIAHETVDDTGRAFPKGDKKRCLAPIIDNCDIVAYVHTNGVDDKGNPVPSSAYLCETAQFFARCRYKYIVPKLEEFTIENLSNAINDAIKKEEELDGVKTVDYSVQQSQNVSEELDYETLYNEMNAVGSVYVTQNRLEELTSIVESVLGQGKKANELKKGQEQIMATVIDALKAGLEG